MHFFILIFEQLVPISGGGTPRITSIIESLVKRGHQVSVAASFNTNLENARKILRCQNIYSLKLVSRLDKNKMLKYLIFHPINIYKVIISIIKTKPDIVIAHNSISGLSGLLAKKIIKFKLVVDMTDLLFEYITYYSHESLLLNLIHKIGRLIETSVIKNADRIITMSKAMREKLIQISSHNKKINVIYDGVNTKIFAFNEKMAKIFKEKYAKGFENVIIFHGVIDPQDRPEIIVEAAKYVVKTNPKTIFWIIGDGAAVPLMKERVNKYQIYANFLFFGWVSYQEIPKFISASDIGLVILPNTASEKIRITLKTFEYWACEKPIIVAELEALKEIVIPWQTGLLYKPDDPMDLAQKITLLMQNKEVSEKMGKEGRKLVENKFDWDILAREFTSICEEIIIE